MIAKQIAGLVERRIRQIQGLPEHPRRAALANLRRGIGRAPGELPELWGSFLQEMPPEFFSRNGNPTAAEWVIYLALTLFALHQQSQEKSMCADGAGIGKAVRQRQTNKGKTRRTAAPLSASAPCLRPTASKKFPITCED